MTKRLDPFTRAYIEAALWSTNDESDESGGEPLDANYTVSDIAPSTMAAIVHDCLDFQKRFGALIEDDESPEIEKWGRWKLAGHKFWLSRNGHGATFLDGDWPKHGEELYDAAESYGNVDLYVSDGVIHAAGHADEVSEAAQHRVATRRTGRTANDRLFIGVYPTGILYADRSREKDGDYARCAFLDFNTLTLNFDRDCPNTLRAEIERDAAKIQARRGEPFETSAAGQTVILGKGLTQAPSRARPQQPHVVRDYIAVDPSGRTVAGPFTDYGAAKSAANSARGFVKFAPGRKASEARRSAHHKTRYPKSR
jgi:hypothetical protein